MSLTVSHFVETGKGRLSAAGLQCADPYLHMKQIVAAAAGWEMTDVYLKWNESLSAAVLEDAQRILERRLTGEPFQYIVGYEWFWNSKFAVGAGVLIPRKETELLVEKLVEISPQEARIAELGAGSGNIAISVLQERPDLQWKGFEINPETWPYLDNNRKALLSSTAQLEIVRADFFKAAGASAPYDGIVSNPPYVAQSAFAALPIEVKHEPKLALVGGPEGAEIIESLAQSAQKWLKPRGFLIMEIGNDQEEISTAIFEKAGFSDVSCTKDYAGLPRMVLGFRRGD